MNRQDSSATSTTGPLPDMNCNAESTSLARRRALLSGLGKGGALVAAAAPVSSFAVGRVKTADGKQCTVSGQMSAVMSQAASELPCVAYHPTYFFNAETLVISGMLTDTPSNQLLKSQLTALGSGRYLNKSDAVYFKRSSTEVRKLTPANRTDPFNTVTLTVGTILSTASLPTARVLNQLHARPDSDETIFLAAFFSTKLTAPSRAEKVPFLDTDVQKQWTARKADAAALYRLVCTAGMDANKLG